MSGGPGYALAEQVSATASRYAMFSGGETVVVALSGGPDSVCLTHVLGRLQAGLTLVVAHVDHGLSPASETVANDVAKWAAAQGLDVHLARASGLEGPNLHARARVFRYSFFGTIARDAGAQVVATGHTLDDRVETLLQRLVHGAGTTTLAGVSPHDGERVRPLIEVRRADTRSYCEEVGLAYVDDPANDDLRFERAAVRNELIPAIEQRWGPGAIPAIARSAQRLFEDGGSLDKLGWTLYEGTVEKIEDGLLGLDLKTMQKLDRALRRRVIEHCLPRHRDRTAAIDELLDALDRTERKPGASFDLGKGVTARFEVDRLVVDTRTSLAAGGGE